MRGQWINPMLSTLLATSSLEHRQRLDVGRDFRAPNFRPGPRPGLRLDELDRPQRSALRRIFADVLTRPAYEMTGCIMSLEDAVASRSGWIKDQQREDYSIFLVEVAGQATLRLEGHHLSLSVAVDGERPRIVLPFCVGAYPAKTVVRDVVTWAPFAPWEMLAAQLATAEPHSRSVVVPSDIMRQAVSLSCRAHGQQMEDMRPTSREVFMALVGSIWDDLLSSANSPESTFDTTRGRFVWAGGLNLQDDHYFALSDGKIAVEYINQRHGEVIPNHVHMAVFNLGSEIN